MQIEFIAKNGDKFTLGSVSFNWLNKHDIFDNYQQDHDYHSECIFKSDYAGMKELAKNVIICAKSDKKLREDIRNKLIRFGEFIKKSDGIHCNYTMIGIEERESTMLKQKNK